MAVALASIFVVHTTLTNKGTCVIKPEFVPFFSVNVVYIMQLSENCSQSVKITNNCQEWGNINKSNVKHSLFVVYVKCQKHSVSLISFFNTIFVFSCGAKYFIGQLCFESISNNPFLLWIILKLPWQEQVAWMDSISMVQWFPAKSQVSALICYTKNFSFWVHSSFRKSFDKLLWCSHRFL